jgi:hypothetical protein
MSGLSGRLAAREREDFGHRRRRQRFLARFAGLVAQQPVYALFGEALLPSPYRWPAGVGPARYRQHRQAVGRQENDPSPLNVFLRPVAIADDRSQSRAILLAQKNTDGLCHAPRIARLNTNLNPMFVSLH